VRGVLITFEGVEGSGKSTQMRRLERWLRREGYRPEITREPDGTALGAAVRRLFERAGVKPQPLTEMFLFMAARQQHVIEKIGPWLRRGAVVISERFADSTLAYQGYAQGVPRERIEELHRVVLGDFGPALTLILDIPVEVGLIRARARLGGAGEDRYERMGQEFHERLRAGYLDIAVREPDRCVIIEADRSVDAVATAIRSEVRERLGIALSE